MRVKPLVAAAGESIVEPLGDPDAPARVDVDIGRVDEQRLGRPQRRLEARSRLEPACRLVGLDLGQCGRRTYSGQREYSEHDPGNESSGAAKRGASSVATPEARARQATHRRSFSTRGSGGELWLNLQSFKMLDWLPIRQVASFVRFSRVFLVATNPPQNTVGFVCSLPHWWRKLARTVGPGRRIRSWCLVPYSRISRSRRVINYRLKIQRGFSLLSSWLRFAKTYWLHRGTADGFVSPDVLASFGQTRWLRFS